MARNILKNLRDPNHPLSIRLSHFPFLLPWFLAFRAASRPERVEKIADSRAALFALGMESYAPLLKDAGAEGLVRRTGSMAVFGSRAALDGAAYSRGLAEARGVKVNILTGDQARAMAPALGPQVQYATYAEEHHQTVNPLRLVQTLAEAVRRRGGQFRTATVRGFDIGPTGVRAVRTDQGDVACDRLLVAGGVWSKALARALGTRVILEAQRGYHAMLPAAGVTLPMMTALADRNVVLSPMEHGFRITGIAEFCHPDAPPAWRHAHRIVAQAKEFVPALNAEGAVHWVGSRPATPDSLPVIGPSPHHRNVLFAFGHGQNGLQMGGVTARLIADLAMGRKPPIDLQPLRPDRF